MRKTATATLFLAGADFTGIASAAASGSQITQTPAVRAGSAKVAWYRRTLRWGQTNITEADAQHYDIAWWRDFWKRTRAQGVIINAGGIVAYYPSKFPLHHRAEGLGDRDLFGDLAAAAHADGLAVLARMDSNRAHEDFYKAHPDWFAVDADGKPYRNTALYVACVNSPYYDEYIPSLLREIIERSRPEGFADNNWSGLDRENICFCENCRKRFRDKSGYALPSVKNWDDPVFREWIQWNYARRIEVWDLFNKVTRDAGGQDCLWLGMHSGSISSQCQRFRDLKAICERSEIVMLDDQGRSDNAGFQHNAETGNLIHGLLGWDKLIPESMAMYQNPPMFRLAARPEPEARLWMLEGFAGGIQPWWHHVGAYQEDRRMFETAAPILDWHAQNERYLINRRPVANVGVVWSPQNTDFYGRDNPEDLVELPRRGWINALVRARIPCSLVHADNIARDSERLSVLILPNLAVITPAQIAAIKQFVEKGGGLIATGETSLYDEWGQVAGDFALADLFGAHADSAKVKDKGRSDARRFAQTQQTYLRLLPELASRVYGPKLPGQMFATGTRHPVLEGFDHTDIVAFGGALSPLKVDAEAKVLATFIPPFPSFPPEEVFMRQPRTDVPALIVNESNNRRVAFLPADLDRRFARENLPDHGNLLANLVRWAARDELPLHVRGAGFIDCHLYEQPGRMVLHLVNLTNAGTWRAPVDELIRVGPFAISVRLGKEASGKHVELRVCGQAAKCSTANGWVHFEAPSILDHEMAVIT